MISLIDALKTFRNHESGSIRVAIARMSYSVTWATGLRTLAAWLADDLEPRQPFKLSETARAFPSPAPAG